MKVKYNKPNVIHFLCIFIFLGLFSESKSDVKAQDANSGNFKEHTIVIEKKIAAYEVELGGTLDGENTLFPCSSQSFHLPEFEPNVSLTIENIGEQVVKNPRIKLPGRGVWFSIGELLNDIIDPEMVEEEKARALYEFHVRHRAHAPCSMPSQYRDPVFFYQSFGFSICSDDSLILGRLWKSVGFDVAPVPVYNHSIVQVKNGEKWHVFDGDQNGLYLLWDNTTVADSSALAYDHYLVKRTHNFGLAKKDWYNPENNERPLDEKAASLYVSESKPTASNKRYFPPSDRMTLNLRPHEKIVYLWENRNKSFGYNAGWYGPSRLYNGYLEYKPEMRSLLDFAEEKDGLFLEKNSLVNNRNGAYLKIPFNSPYPIVGGIINATLSGNADSQLSIFLYGKGTRILVSRLTGTNKPFSRTMVLDRLLPKAMGSNRSDVQIQLVWDRGRVNLENLHIRLDLQMAPLGMPSLRCGKNSITYMSDSEGKVKVIHRWRETLDNNPPPPPPKPIVPKNNSKVKKLSFTFMWKKPKDPDADEIADFHFLLSDRPDCRWALSPNFEKINSRTKDAGKAQYTIPSKGLLNPGKTYYWKVRARDERGAWSEWSRIWRFKTEGPVKVKNLRYRIDGPRIYLEWDKNADGSKSKKYCIYGSNEQGFTPKAKPHLIFGLWPLPHGELYIEAEPFKKYDTSGQLVKVPGNLITTVKRRSVQVVGPDLDFKKGYNRVFYRVEAIDHRGASSGCGQFIELPHPFIYSDLPDSIKAGQSYTWTIGSLYSLGRVTAGRPDYHLQLKETERIKYSLQCNCEGFSIDEESGELTGKVENPPEDGIVELKVIAKGAKGKSHARMYKIKVE